MSGPTAGPDVSPTRQTRSVATKICAVLDAIAAAPEGLSATEVGLRTGMPLSTAHRLIQTLAAWGGLERQPTGRYRAGLRLWEVASTAPRASGLRDVARPYLEDLYEATRENVQLAIRDGDAALVLEHFATRSAIPTAARIGGRLPLHASGVGQVLLAFAPAAEQTRVLNQPLQRFNERTIVEPGMLRAVLADIRQAGVAIAASSMPLPALAIAAPVFSAKKEIAAAVAVVLPSDRTHAAPYIAAVVTTALGISRRLSEASRFRP